MAQIKVRGIVADTAPMGEKDKRLVILTKELGKISVLAKGARSQAGKQAAPSQLFCTADFVLDKGRTFYYIKEYEILETFYSLRMDVERLSYASVMLETARLFSLDGEDNTALFQLLIRGLHAMQKNILHPQMIMSTFLLRLLADNGYRPQLSSCIRCGKPYDGQSWFFDPLDGGLVCPEHRNRERLTIGEGAVHAMRYICDAKEADVFRFKVTDSLRREIYPLIRDFLRIHAGTTPKSLEFAENLENPW